MSAITFIEQLKKQRILIIIFLIVILITAFVIWRGFFVKEKPLEKVISGPVKKVQIDFEIFKNPLLEKLQPIEKIEPVGAEAEIGRDNPFEPY